MRFRALCGGLFAVGLWLFVPAVQAATVLFVSAKDYPSPPSAWAWRPSESYSEPAKITDRAGRVLYGFWATLLQGRVPTPDGDTPLETACRKPNGRADVVVALGWEVARIVARECDRPLLAVQVTHRQWMSGFDALPIAPRTALYLEADPRRHLPLIRAFLPQARRIGLLTPPDLPDWLPPLREAARAAGFELVEIPAGSDQEAVRALRVHLAGLDAVLLPPDSRLINEWSLKPLLLMTVRQGIPMFGGLTARYVEAGVMAAAVADEASLLDQIRALIADLARGKAPAPVYPAPVRVAVNPTVARNLNLSDEAIERGRATPSRP